MTGSTAPRWCHERCHACATLCHAAPMPVTGGVTPCATACHALRQGGVTPMPNPAPSGVTPYARKPYSLEEYVRLSKIEVAQ